MVDSESVDPSVYLPVNHQGDSSDPEPEPSRYNLSPAYPNPPEHKSDSDSVQSSVVDPFPQPEFVPVPVIRIIAHNQLRRSERIAQLQEIRERAARTGNRSLIRARPSIRLQNPPPPLRAQPNHYHLRP